MKKLMSLAILAVTGCASGGAREEGELRRKVDELEKALDTKNAQAVNLYRDLLDKHDKLQKKVLDMEHALTVVDSALKRIEERLKGGGQIPNGGGKTEDTNPKAVDVATTTSEALLSMKTGKLSWEQVSAQLKGIARDAAPILVDELKRSATDRTYATRLIAILSSYPAETVRDPVTRALSERSIVRNFAARIIGNLKDRETSKALEAHAASDDEDFRLVVGESLCACRNAAGVPVLVDLLKSNSFEVRIISFETLRTLNKGESFGYRASKPAENAEALQKWEEWAKGPGAKLFE
jgi:HEAT repeat protein